MREHLNPRAARVLKRALDKGLHASRSECALRAHNIILFCAPSVWESWIRPCLGHSNSIPNILIAFEGESPLNSNPTRMSRMRLEWAGMHLECISIAAGIIYMYFDIKRIQLECTSFECRRNHSKYILSIRAAFCLNYWTFEPYSAAIPGAFWLHSRWICIQHSRHLPTRLRAVLGQQSNRTRTAFEVHYKYSGCIQQHFKYSYCVVCSDVIHSKQHSRANTPGMCKNHSITKYSNGILTKLYKNFGQFEIPSRM